MKPVNRDRFFIFGGRTTKYTVICLYTPYLVPVVEDGDVVDAV